MDPMTTPAIAPPESPDEPELDADGVSLDEPAVPIGLAEEVADVVSFGAGIPSSVLTLKHGTWYVKSATDT